MFSLLFMHTIHAGFVRFSRVFASPSFLSTNGTVGVPEPWPDNIRTVRSNT